ncbi:MAG TPA: hypothetical protein VGF81_16960 [Solirubrobacteraceae bacterium]
MRASLAAALLAVVVVGCGSASHRPTVCAPRGRALLAVHLAVAQSAVSAAVSKGNNGMPQCVLTVRRPGMRPVQVTVNLDNGPQPFFRLERTAVEATQQFGTERLYAAPDQVMGLGLDADWYPDSNYLETTDGRRLITATIAWPGSSQAQRRALSIAIARPFLGRLHHNPNAGY